MLVIRLHDHEGCNRFHSGMIDGIPIETSYQAWNELMKCKKSGKKYQAIGDMR